MDFLNDLGKTLSNVAKQVETKSGELLDAGRWNMEILKEEDAIRKAYRRIGEQIYTEYAKGESYAGKADELCDEIRRRKNRIEALKARLREAKKAEEKAKKEAEEKAEEQSAESQDNQDSYGESPAESEADKEESSGEPEISYFEAVEKMKKGKDGNS